MANVLTIRDAVKRAKDEGYPISEYTLRRWVKSGIIPARMIGAKALIYYPHLISYLCCETSCDNAPDAEIPKMGIRRIEVNP